MADRRLRNIPSSKPNLVVTPRDAKILLAVAECGHVPLSLIAMEGFDSEDRARKRMRRLYDSRLVSVTLLSSRESNVYSIRREGLRALQDLGHDVTGLKLPAPLRSTEAYHRLLITGVRFALANLRLEGHGELHEWESGTAVARQWGLHQAHLVPDGLAVATVAGVRRRLAIECDRGFMGAEWTEKCAKYASLPRRADFELWVCAVGDAARLNFIRSAAVRAGIAGFTRVLPVEWVYTRPLPAVPPLASQGG